MAKIIRNAETSTITLSDEAAADPLAHLRVATGEAFKKVFLVPSEEYKQVLAKANITTTHVCSKITDTLATQLKAITDTVVITGLVEKPLHQAVEPLIKAGLIVKVIVPPRTEKKEVKQKKKK